MYLNCDNKNSANALTFLGDVKTPQGKFSIGKSVFAGYSMKDFMFSGHVSCLGVSQQKCLPSFVILFYVGMEIKRKNEFGRRPANIDWILLYAIKVICLYQYNIFYYIQLYSQLCSLLSYVPIQCDSVHTYIINNVINKRDRYLRAFCIDNRKIPRALLFFLKSR